MYREDEIDAEEELGIQRNREYHVGKGSYVSHVNMAAVEGIWNITLTDQYLSVYWVGLPYFLEEIGEA